MTAKIINGKEISAKLREKIAAEVLVIKEKSHQIPGLAVVLVGSDPASEVYVRNKEKASEAVGINSYKFHLPETISENDLIKKIEELNHDKNVHGILVQLPLPKHIDSNKVIHTIDSRKDVDGFNVLNVGKLTVGNVSGVDGALVPCTPLGSIHLIKEALGDNLKGLKALVVGSSNIVGRPVARLLGLENCTVTIANRSTRDLKGECLQADILVVATGVPNLIKADMVKKGAVVIDVGINRIVMGEKDGKPITKLVGDVDFENVQNVASAITPVPGGVGPMTIAYLLNNTLNCYYKLTK